MKKRFCFKPVSIVLLLVALTSAIALAGCNGETGNDGPVAGDPPVSGEGKPSEEQPSEEVPSQTPVTYTVTFESNGGTEIAAFTYSPGGEALTLPEPFRYQYVFGGWYADESCTGDAAPATNYMPAADTLLYAKWTPCVYLYLYYGVDGFEAERQTYFAGDSVQISDLFTPEAITVDGAVCPFVKWTYEDGTEIEEDEIVFAEENVLLLAQYDESAIPIKKYLEENEDGSYTATGKVAWIFLDEGKQIGRYSATVTFGKGAGGAAGIAFRMSPLPGDYAFEGGCNYLAAQFAPQNGGLQVCSVTNGVWAQMTGSVVALTKLPAAWQNKYNANETVTAEIAVVDYGDKFEIYIDGELAYTFADTEILANYPGTGFGVRCSTIGAIFSDPAYRAPVTVSFEPNGGSECESVIWYGGALQLPVSERSGYALTGWYYDEACERKAEANGFTATGNTTLYAGWSREFYTVSFESNGGAKYDDVRYVSGGIDLPVPARVNYAFTGWYYEQACENAVDAENPAITDDATLYAGWRLLVGNVTDNGDGTFTTKGSTSALAGEGNGLYGEVTMSISFAKGAGGAVGIMFRASNTQDNQIEKGQYYLSVQIVPGSGSLQVSKVEGGFAHLTGSVVALTKLPAAWQTKYNAAETGATVTVTLKVVYEPDKFYAYIDGDPAYNYAAADSEIIAAFTGTGYGVRSSTTPATYGVTYRDMDQAPNAVCVSFESNGGPSCEDVSYVGGFINLPVLTRANYAFTGWYYEQACENKVDAGAPRITANATLYAGWRLLVGNVTDNGDGTFTTGGTTSALAGEGNGLYGEVTMSISFAKGAGGAVGIMFRASNTQDNQIETGQHYLTVQMVPNGGILQIARINGDDATKFVTLTGNKAALSTLPAAWQTKYNAAGTGATITVTLKVVYEPDKFYAYIDGDLAYTSAEADAATIATFTGAGYGVRSSTTPATYSVTYTDRAEGEGMVSVTNYVERKEEEV